MTLVRARGVATPPALLLLVTAFGKAALAHDHHEGGVSHIADGDTVSKEPIVGGIRDGRMVYQSADRV